MSGCDSVSGFILSLMLILPGLVMVLGSRFWYRNSKASYARLVLARGNIVRFNWGVNPGGAGFHHNPVVEFHTQFGEAIEFQSAHEFTGAKVGRTVRIRYDPQNPQGAEVDTFFTRWKGQLKLVFVGGGCIIGGLALAYFTSQVC